MMKSFFKKLAFVMALAMVVTLAAPAGSALAAASGIALQGTSTIVETYELKVEETVDFCFKGAPSDWKTTFKWTTSNEAVATVDQTGLVTAVAAGTATITITAGADASYVETVVITVPSGIEFTAVQKNTTDVVLTFPEGTDMSAVVADDFTITAIDETFEYTLFANEVAANKNVVTLGFVDGVLSDGATLKIAYKEAEVTLVASNGDAVSATIQYGMNSKKLEGDAYVYTDLDPDYVYLAYTLYDANGIDVTANYDIDDFDNLEWSVANGENIAYIDYDSDKEMDVVCFEEKGAASVKLEITFVDEDGNEEVISTVTPIVAKDRPAIAFNFVEAGLFNPTDKENVVAAVNSFNDHDGTIWGTDAYASSIVKDGTAWFGAALVNNREDGLVSTVLSYEEGIVAGDTECGDYGYFTYASSNDNVIDIDADGYVTAINTGSATILVSFVAYDEDGEELPAKKVGSKRISVYAQSYPASYALTLDNTTVTTSGSALSNVVYLQVFDQFGNAMGNWADWWSGGMTSSELTDAVSITAVSENYEDITGYFVLNQNFDDDPEMDGYVPTWPAATGWTPSYPITFYGNDFVDLVKSGKYSTFKFDVTIDKEVEAFEKVSTKTDRAIVKVYNVDEYFGELADFYAGDDTVEVNKNYSVWQSKDYIDVWTDIRSEFGDGNTGWVDPIKYASVGVDLLSGSGLKLMSLPADYFIELPKENGKYINTKDMEDPVAGAIYYTISYATKDKNNVSAATGATVDFTFNTVSGDELSLADLGNYTVTLYSVNSRDKLVKLDSKTINVGSSMNKVTYEGFKDGNVYEDGEVTDANIVSVLEDLCEFKWNGTKLSDDWADFSIVSVDGTDAEGKYRVEKIYFEIKAYNDEVTTNGEDSYGYKTYTYELKRNITIYDGE